MRKVITKHNVPDSMQAFGQWLTAKHPAGMAGCARSRSGCPTLRWLRFEHQCYRAMGDWEKRTVTLEFMDGSVKLVPLEDWMVEYENWIDIYVRERYGDSADIRAYEALAVFNFYKVIR